QLGDYVWYNNNSDKKTHPVGTKRPNAWGLYDMHGNVEEWCQDYEDDYPDGDVTDPLGPGSGSFRVFRGGSWLRDAWYCRSAYRLRDWPTTRYNDLGFRVSLVPDE
ncbi:MAG: SUMF1/EgtB/PvdO family nonheme iron enzyme, partial [Planctomycetales bacterium]|nr:SUMF1/EgtB/PvdO family nonheme iron enzyme [Planctomycetales bacterium]